MSEASPRDNPYGAPSTEKYSATLTSRERDLLIALLDVRERTRFGRAMSVNVVTSLWLTPVAIAFGVVVAGAAYAITGGAVGTAVWIGIAAFAAALAGFLFRDLVDASNTQQLWEVQVRITDFDEIERLLYDRHARQTATAPSDEPLAAIPVEDEPPSVEDRTR